MDSKIHLNLTDPGVNAWAREKANIMSVRISSSHGRTNDGLRAPKLFGNHLRTTSLRLLPVEIAACKRNKRGPVWTRRVPASMLSPREFTINQRSLNRR